jgi:hypothetical protein
MRTIPNCGTRFWSAGLLGIVLLPGPLWGQQTSQDRDDSYATAIAADSGPDLTEPQAPEPPIQIGFVPNWKQLLAIAIGDDGGDPRKRFIVSYEQMLFGGSPMPVSSVVDSKARHEGPHIVPAASLPTATGSGPQSFATAVLENLGSSATSSPISRLGTGGRLEFGRMETNDSGWSVSILELNNSDQDAQSQGGNRGARPR